MFEPPYSALFELVTVRVTDPALADDLGRAREEYFRHAGEVSEEHFSHELRIQGFVDWYCFDRVLPATGNTPLESACLDPLFSDEQRQALLELSENVHGLFELRKHKDQELRVRDLITRKEHGVSVLQAIPGLERGDIFEARLVPHQGQLHFSPAFLLHPRAVRRQLLKGIKRFLKQGVGTTELVWLLSRMAARAEQYKGLAVNQVYDFDNPPPVSRESRLLCDPASVAQRLSRSVTPLPLPTPSEETLGELPPSADGEEGPVGVESE